MCLWDGIGLCFYLRIPEIIYVATFIAMFTVLTVILSVANLGKVLLGENAITILVILRENRNGLNQTIEIE